MQKYNKALSNGVDNVCRNAVADGIPGISAIVTDSDQTLHETAFGRSSETGSRMSVDTVVDIASMTKPIAATAAMQLVEQGKLELDAPAARYVSDIDTLKVLIEWNADKPVLRAPKRALTMRHLLTHTAGMGYDVWSPNTKLYNTRHAIPSVNSGDPRSLTGALMNDPGEAWLYGTSIDWVSRIVEEVSGQTFGDYLERYIFRPLGMQDTGYDLTASMRARMAKIYVREGSGNFVQSDRERNQNPPVEFGGAGLYSTARDYIKFVRLLLNGGNYSGHQVLQPETVKMMGRNAMGDLRVVGLKSSNPAFARDLELFPGVEKSWGLSFLINEAKAPTGRAPGSLSWAGIFNTYFWIDPTTRIGGVMMTQTTPFLDPKVYQTYLDFERFVYDVTG